MFDIILPTIGRESLFAAINSVCFQQYENWQLHVIEDGICIRDTISKAFSDEPRIRWHGLFEQRGHYGAFARNFAIHNSQHEWIAYIDDDDEWLHNHLETIARLINDNPGLDMVRTAGQSFMMKHKSPRSSKLIRKMGPVNSTDILTVGIAHTRSIFKQTSGWKPEDNHDHTLWREMLAAGGKAIESDEVTFHFRR